MTRTGSLNRGHGPVSYPRETPADRRAVNRFRLVATVALVVLVTIATTGCATGPEPDGYDPDDITIDATVRDMQEACTEAGGHMSQSDGACYLPGRDEPAVYTPWCGYLPPVLGDDC